MSAQSVTLIHIHEDDWGLRSLHPATTWSEVAGDLAASREAAERNRDPAGRGFSAMHVIVGPSTNYRDAGLRIAAAAPALEPIMPRVRRFYATATAGFRLAPGEDVYGSYKEDAWCFGRGNHCYIYLVVRDDFVEEICFDLGGDNTEDAAAMRLAFQAIDRLVPSMIVDYPLELQGLVGDGDFLDDYFRRLAGDDDEDE